MKIRNTELSILLTSLLLGVLIVVQSRSFTNISDIVVRDTRANVFREIQLLKKTTENLEDEITELEEQLAKGTDQEKALQGIREEIVKYNILTGKIDVTGPGVSLTINGDIKALWFTDIVNELFTAGAEAVSVNKIRLVDQISGFDTIPNGEILLNGVILKEPFVFEAIGDRKVLEEALKQPQGILQRMTQGIEGFEYGLEQRDLITMKKLI